MSIRLKKDFHRWSRWYPERWRAENAATMLATYLDVADATGRDRLGLGDKLSLVVGGVTARGLAIVPRDVQRQASSLLVGMLGAYALFTGIVLEWAPWGRSARHNLLARINGHGAGTEHLFGPFVDPFVVVAALAVASWIACLCASDRVYRSMLGVTVVAGIAAATIAHFGVGSFLYQTATPSLFAAGLALFSLVTARPRPRVVGLCTGSWIIVFLASAAIFGPTPFSALFSRGAYGAAMFFDAVLQPGFTYSLSLVALLGATVLALSGRIRVAAVIVITSTPFAALTILHGWSRRDPVFLGALLAAYAIALAFAIGRASRRSTPRQQHGIVVD